MGFISKLFKVTAVGGTTAAGSYVYATRKSRFVPLDLSSDPITSSPYYLKYNPNRNPATHDLCVRSVPLENIRSDLLEKDGSLVQSFCAGLWGGAGTLVLFFEH
jgi:hypothetical protein